MAVQPVIIQIILYIIILFCSIAVIFMGYSIVDRWDCEIFLPQLDYSMIDTTCNSYGNRTLVEIKCDGLNNIGFVIDKTPNFTIKQECWYNSGNVDRKNLVSNIVMSSNMSVVYKMSLEVYFYNNYLYCKNRVEDIMNTVNYIGFTLFGLSLTTIAIYTFAYLLYANKIPGCKDDV